MDSKTEIIPREIKTIYRISLTLVCLMIISSLFFPRFTERIYIVLGGSINYSLIMFFFISVSTINWFYKWETLLLA